MRGQKGEVDEGMGKGKSLGMTLQQEGRLLFLNCRLLNANYGLYDG